MYDTGMLQRDYTIQLNEVTLYAAQAAKDVATCVLEKRIDQNNLVIQLGEFHSQLSHRLFMTSFADALRQEMTLTHFCDETDASKQEEMISRVSKSGFDDTLNNLSKADRVDFAKTIPCAYALSNQMAYHAIDMNIRPGGHGLLAPVERSRVARFEHLPYFQKIFKDCDYIFTETKYSEVSVFGCFQRDVAMVTNIADIADAKPGTVLALNGLAHMASVVQPGVRTLADMLVHANKDLVTIAMHASHPCGITSPMEETFRQSLQYMLDSQDEKAKRHHLLHLNVTIPESGHQRLGGWQDLKAMQKYMI